MLVTIPPKSVTLTLTGQQALLPGVAFILGTLGIGLGYPGQPHVVNRFMALRDQRALNRGRLIALDTPRALRSRVVEPILELTTDDAPRAVEALDGAPGVLEAAMFGRALREDSGNAPTLGFLGGFSASSSSSSS